MATKRALLIGVNRYIHLEDRYQLKGCVNDAKLYKSVLTGRFGFDEAHLVELHDAEATRQAILNAMEDLLERVETDDIVVFQFAGHGRQRTSRSTSEGTGKDSTIMPTDSGGKDRPNLDIDDNEIEAWLEKLTKKTEYITLIFDCCHSGTMTRDVFAGAVRGVEEDDRTLEEMQVEPLARPKAERGEGSSKWLPLSDRYVVISGCRDNERSKEEDLGPGHQFDRNGVLSFNFCNALVNATPQTTYRDAFDEARVKVTAKFNDQHPQIEGRINRAVFGVKDIEPMRFVLVSGVDGTKVTLAGGAAQGLDEGSKWSIYPAGTKSTQGVSPVAVVEVNSVDAVSAEVTAPENAGVSVGMRAVLERRAPNIERYMVDLSLLDDKRRAELEPRIAESQLLDVSPSSAIADARVQVLEKRESVTEDDFLESLGPLSEDSWAISDRGGAQLGSAQAMTNDDAIKTLVFNLDTAARYKNALALNNPVTELDIKLEVFRVDDSGEREPRTEGELKFKAGDKIGFEITNNSDHQVFFSLLDFGLTKGIKLLYPRNKASELLLPGVSVAKQGLRLNMGDFKEDEGYEVYRVFASTEETDFSWLAQESTRSVQRSKLVREFQQAYEGSASRDSEWEDEEDAAAAPADWCAVSRAFRLRR